jgi:nucleotide-binding universal stress UspA family protein/predicted phosphoribosyltransferase
MRILVPTDFSAASDRALGLATTLAPALGATVSLFHAYELPDYAYWAVRPVDVEALRREAEREMEAAALGLRALGCCGEAHVVRAPAWQGILDHIETERPDLVIMGTHGRRGLSRAVVGSVAERVVQLSPVPVMVVPRWAFEDRADAGRRLAQALAGTAGLRVDLPSVIGVGPSSAPVAYEIARSLGGSMDVVSVDPHALPDHRATSLVDGLSLRVLSDRTAIVTSDAVRDPLPIEIAVREARAAGARRVVAAIPALAPRVEDALRREADDVVCVEHTLLPASPRDVYQRAGSLSRRDLRDLFARAQELPMSRPARAAASPPAP